MRQTYYFIPLNLFALSHVMMILLNAYRVRVRVRYNLLLIMFLLTYFCLSGGACIGV